MLNKKGLFIVATLYLNTVHVKKKILNKYFLSPNYFKILSVSFLQLGI